MYLIFSYTGKGTNFPSPLFLHGNMFAFTPPKPSTTTTMHHLPSPLRKRCNVPLNPLNLYQTDYETITTNKYVEHVYMWSLHGKLHLFSSISDYTNFYINMFYTYVPNTTCKTDYF